MNRTAIEAVAVLGAGTMGQGIARVCSAAGLQTLLFDISEERVRMGMESIEKGLAKEEEKGKLSSLQRKAIHGRIVPCTDLADLKADLVIEAAVEDLSVKQGLLREIEKQSSHSGKAIILATNTSSLSVTQIASVLNSPAFCVGLHFFNPAHRMKLVEVVAGNATDPDVVLTMVEFAKKIGKTPVVAKDSPGFIVNRVARHYYAESLRLLEENSADVTGIDALLRSAGFRMGPFELMDLIGIDINFAVTQSIYQAFHEAPRFKPSRTQQQKVAAGEWGRKTGKGFYTYEKN